MEVLGLILAGGRGTRMGAGLPKVLRPHGSQAMIQWVVNAVRPVVQQGCYVVLSNEHHIFGDFLNSNPDLGVLIQHEPKGTGDAVACAHVLFDQVPTPPYAHTTLLKRSLDVPSQADAVLICTADTPKLTSHTLNHFIQSMDGADFGVIGCRLDHPTGYGRLLTAADHSLERIVEEKDANEEQKRINLVNSGVLYARIQPLFESLCQLTTQNNAKEYYLTDIFKSGARTKVFEAPHSHEFIGVNTPEELNRLNLAT